MERITLDCDVQVRGVLIHAGSEVTLAPVVANDWRARGYTKTKAKRGKRVDTGSKRRTRSATGDGGESEAEATATAE